MHVTRDVHYFARARARALSFSLSLSLSLSLSSSLLRERELPTRGTNRLMMIGQFHTPVAAAATRPSSVITLFIICRVSRLI